MHLAYVEGIEIRSQIAGELHRVLEVAGQIHIVVVVSYGVENRQVLDLVHVSKVLLELIIPVIPVIVPGHIAECQREHLLRLAAFDIIVHVIAEL